MLSRLTRFLNTDIWRIRLAEYPRPKSFLLQQLRVIALAFRGYHEDSCKFRASALTFYSLLSIVPVLAMLFGIAKGFGLEKRVQTEILESFKGQEEVAQRIIAFANSLLDNARGGLIAGVGVLLLFWSVMSVLGNIEHSFNEIWGVTKLTIKRVVDALENRGDSHVPVLACEELKKLTDAWAAFGQIVEQAPANVTLKKI